MIKKIIACFIYFSSFNVFACPDALPTNDANFCASFREVAICYCTISGLPVFLCQDITKLYNRMVAVFGSLENACAHQQYTSSQICLDNWNCYLHGGVDSRGNVCSSTGAAC